MCDPRQLAEDEAKETARRAYTRNPKLTATDIGKAISRARQTVGEYISDLRAAIHADLNSKIFKIVVSFENTGRVMRGRK